MSMKPLILVLLGWLAAAAGCAPWESASAPARESVLAVGNANNLYVAAVGASGGTTIFKCWQRDARGTWRYGGAGQGTPAAMVAWREQLMVIFPSGRYGLFGFERPQIFPSPAQAWIPVAACEDGLAVDALGWAGRDPWRVRCEDGKWTSHPVEAPLERDKILDPAMARFLGRLYILWREEVPTLTGAEAEFRLRFVYLEKGKWQGPLTASRLQIASAPLVASDGSTMVSIYRKPGETAWTMGNYVSADEDWHEVRGITGPVPPGPVALARQGPEFYLVGRSDQRPAVAPLDVKEARVGGFEPVQGDESAATRGSSDGTPAGWLLFSLSLLAFLVILMTWQRARQAAGPTSPAPPPTAAGEKPIVLYAPLARRGVALAIDLIVPALLLATGLVLTPLMQLLMPHTYQAWAPVLQGLATGPSAGDQAAMLRENLVFQAILRAIVIFYFTSAEAAFGKTMGKWLMGLEVRSETGGRPSLAQAFVRNVLRIIDELPVFYLVGLFCILTGPRPQRLGDRVAHTAVVVSGSPRP